MPEPIRKRRFVPGQGKKFDPTVHLDLRFISQRKRQVGRRIGGNVVLTKKEYSKIQKPSVPVFIPEDNIGFVEFFDRRNYHILAKGSTEDGRKLILAKGRRKEDREFSD